MKMKCILCLSNLSVLLLGSFGALVPFSLTLALPPETPAVSATIVRSASEVVISWPATGSEWILEFNAADGSIRRLEACCVSWCGR